MILLIITKFTLAATLMLIRNCDLFMYRDRTIRNCLFLRFIFLCFGFNTIWMTVGNRMYYENRCNKVDEVSKCEDCIDSFHKKIMLLLLYPIVPTLFLYICALFYTALYPNPP